MCPFMKTDCDEKCMLYDNKNCCCAILQLSKDINQLSEDINKYTYKPE